MRRLLKKRIATGIDKMTEKQILDVVYRQVVLAEEQNLTDKAPDHFKQLKEFIEEEREKAQEAGGSYL